MNILFLLAELHLTFLKSLRAKAKDIHVSLQVLLYSRTYLSSIRIVILVEAIFKKH